MRTGRPSAASAVLEEARATVHADPGGWIAQDPVLLSTHPTVVGDRIEPRHVDLRPFAFCDGGDVTVDGEQRRIEADFG